MILLVTLAAAMAIINMVTDWIEEAVERDARRNGVLNAIGQYAVMFSRLETKLRSGKNTVDLKVLPQLPARVRA